MSGEVVVAGSVLERERIGLGKLAGGVDIAEKDIGDCAAARLAAEIAVEQSLCLAYPRHLDNCAASKDDNDVLGDSAYSAEQGDMLGRDAKMGSVEALRLELVGKTDEQNCDIRFLCSFDCIGYVSLGRIFLLLLSHRVAVGIDNIDALFEHGVICAVDFYRVDKRAAGALMTRLLCHLTDNCNLCLLAQGQDIVVVLEKHHALTRNLACRRVMLARIVALAVCKNFLCAHDNINNAVDHLIEEVLADLAALDCVIYLSVAVAVRGGHLEVLTCEQTENTVVLCAPVGDYHALKAEIMTEDISKEPLVFCAVDAVEAVIHAHDGPGLSLLDGYLISGEIYLAQSSLVNNCADGHSAGLLAVDRVMLERSADTLGLNAVYESGRHLAGKIRIFRKILKVSAAEGRTLHIRSGAEQDGDLLRYALLAEELAHAVDKLGIP